MFKIMILIMMMLLTSFTMLNHPMSMGMVILMSTTLISMMMGPLSPSFWFSYILFLVMIGGLLILFIYMTSIVANEKFKFSLKMLLIMVASSFMFMLILNTESFTQMMTMKNMFMEMEFTTMKNLNLLSINKIYNNPNNLITIMMINYLLMTLIMVVKLTNIKQGPVRQKN